MGQSLVSCFLRHSVEENSTVTSVHACHTMSIPNFKHKMQTGNLQSQSSKLRSLTDSADLTSINTVLKISMHVLHPLLPPPVSHTQRYGL